MLFTLYLILPEEALGLVYTWIYLLTSEAAG